MMAALFNVLKYFDEKKEDFTEHFTQKLLVLFEKKVQDPNFPIEDQMSNDIFNI